MREHRQRYRKFCEILVEARKSRGITQSELADRLDKPQSYVSKFESGERRLDVIEFLTIVDACSFDLKDILTKLKRKI